MQNVIETKDALLCYYDKIIEGSYHTYNMPCNFCAIDKKTKKYIEYSSFNYSNFTINYEIIDKYIEENIINDTHKSVQGFVLMNNPWTYNFSHMLNETLPRIMVYLDIKKNTDVKMIIHTEYYYDYVKEILQLFGIYDNDIVLIPQKNDIYQFDKLFTANICGGLSIPNEEIKIVFFTKLRQLIYDKIKDNLLNNTDVNRILYIKRNDKIMTGKARELINENEIINELKRFNCNVVDNFSEKNIFEKAKLLYNAKIIITPLGANLMNIAFSNNPKKMIVLTNGIFRTTYHNDLFNNIGEKMETYYVKGIMSDQN